MSLFIKKWNAKLPSNKSYNFQLVSNGQKTMKLCTMHSRFMLFGEKITNFWKTKRKKRNALILIYFRGSIITFMECLFCFHTEIIDLLNKCKCDNPGDQIEYIFLNREPSELCLPKWLLFILIDIFQLCEIKYWLMVKLGVEIVKM